jgi:DNA-nicking Smr family endonuclease
MQDDEKRKNKGLSSNDLSLWREVTRDVKRFLGRDYEESAPASSDKSNSPAVQRPHSEAPLPRLPDEASQGSGLDHRMDERLRKGKMKIEARLDMHGLNQAEAHRALNETLLGAYNQGKRCVLVITGKGTRSAEEGGVLRKNLPVWLGLAPLSHIVLQVHTAKQRHGGEGAFYILLRRQR